MNARYILNMLAALYLSSASAAAATELKIPKISEALKIEDFDGMKPRSDLAEKLAHVQGFIQSSPKNGAPPTQQSEVYLAYNDTTLYIVFVCFDTEAKKIRSVMTRRENITDDEDWVEVYLDTYNDRRRSYVLSTNALGVQWDSRYIEQQGHQPSFDALWYSDGKITDRGYIVWMAIPFKSLRFPSAGIQNWRIVLGRNIPRSSEYSSWPHISREIEGTLNQSSLVTGLQNISPGKNIQFIPYTSFRSFRLLDTENGNPHFISDSSDAAAGLDAKLVVKDSFVVDAALNPDFSQVESDEPQVTVNQRFEVFFPEKRPFFLENAQYFETPTNLVFTRRIADPQFGGRVTGKYGPYTLGVLYTNDEAPGKRFDEQSPFAGSDAYYGIVRVTRDIFSQSSIGMLFTDRSFEDSSNTVFGIDARLRLNDKWQASLQAVQSRTTPLEGESFSGPAYWASLVRGGQHFGASFVYLDRSPDFRTLTGFIPRADYRRTENLVRYFFRPEGKFLVAWGPRMKLTYSWDHAGQLLDYTYNPSLYIELQRRTFINLHYYRDREHLRRVDFPGLEDGVDFDPRTVMFSFNTSYWEKLSGGFSFQKGSSINFVPAPGNVPTTADVSSGSIFTTMRPLQNVQVQSEYLYTALRSPSGPTIFNDHIVRSKINWQWNRELSFRMILQYDATIVNSDLTSLENRRNLNGDFLITYLVNPWTALYVGYNGNRQNLLFEQDENGVVNLIRTPGAFINDANQFFLKFSYLFRF